MQRGRRRDRQGEGKRLAEVGGWLKPKEERSAREGTAQQREGKWMRMV